MAVTVWVKHWNGTQKIKVPHGDKAIVGDLNQQLVVVEKANGEMAAVFTAANILGVVMDEKAHGTNRNILRRLLKRDANRKAS